MKHIHIIGIGGTFMASLALLARAAGFEVTGCDGKLWPPMSTQLENAGLSVHEGFDAAQLDEFAADVYVIGNVARRGMEVIEEILNRRLPYVSGPQWLTETVLPGRRAAAVAGTHGKTTTASMLAWILTSAGLNTGFLIGGVPRDFDVSARLPEVSSAPSYFVIEADEYDTAFFDKRSKFVHYRPEIAILNNLEYDHADIFPDLAAIETQFHHLVRTVPGNGLLVVNAASESIARVLKRGAWTPLCPFGVESAWHPRATSAQSFEVFSGSLKTGEVSWSLTGAHNMLNATAAIAAAAGFGVDVVTSCRALSTFRGVKRRMEIKGEVDGITVCDDFAHHPTAIAATLAGVRTAFPGRRLVAVTEPRSNTMKSGSLKDDLPRALSCADAVFAYAGGIEWSLTEALRPLGERALVYDDFDAMLAALVDFLRPGDMAVIMSNGGFQGIHAKLLSALRARPR